MERNLDRSSKRRRVNEEDQPRRSNHRQLNSSDREASPSHETPLDGHVATTGNNTWTYPATAFSNAFDYQFSDWDGRPYQTLTVEEPPPYNLDTSTITPLDAPVHYSINTRFLDYRTPPIPSQQSFVPDVPLDQWGINPEEFLNSSPWQQSRPYDRAQSQDHRLYPDSPAAQTGSFQEGEEIVCYGMVPSISAKYDKRGSTQLLPTSFSVELNSSVKFSTEEFPDIQGQVLSEHGQMIQGLLDESSLKLFACCLAEDTQSTETRGRGSNPSPVSCLLQITVYGPLELFDEIGTWFEDYQVFLQDPRQCHLDVRYCNPHRLSSGDTTSCPRLSKTVSQDSTASSLETIAQRPDLLDELSNYEDLEETPQPSAIKQELRRHQKQALTFMLRRERGWAFFDSEPDVWEIVDGDQGRFFLNRVSNASQTEEPPQCYGGIVADPMGLGKTLTMIALVATDLEEADTQMLTGEEDYPDVPTTLIIVPPPLIGTWEEQLSDHVIKGGLTCRRHHREGRLTSIKELEATNIVLTTYHTVSAEWSPSGKAKSSVLYSVRWRRIILDEAHLIRNGNSRMSHAICALESRARWAVTGTPIQNRLGDLATLFKFIRAHPYTDRRCFDTDISRLWKTGEYQEAIKRLKRLSKCLLLRRDKGTVSLPPRQDLQCPVDFDPEERAFYNRLREQAISSINEVLKNDSGSSRSGAYVNVLQQIEALRLVCNLGLHYNSRHAKALSTPQADNWTELAQDAFTVRREIEPIVCLQCSSTLDITETVFEELQLADQNPLFFSCLGFICTDCLKRSKKTFRCGHSPSCAEAHVSTGGQALEASLPGVQSQTNKRLPSKVEALIADIKALPPNEKCIVFSTWRLTLDVVEAGLNQSGISSVRFDGKVPQKDRQNIVDRFRHDSSICVMLLTLSCGAAGLTLTVATRAYLMEPHWNPTVEEQALARIHRIGQSREVTTVRFFVRDSFEQQVIKVQESKRYLAGLLLSPHDTGQANENLGRLQELLSLI